jgi:hypothetical protein
MPGKKTDEKKHSKNGNPGADEEKIAEVLRNPGTCEGAIAP